VRLTLPLLLLPPLALPIALLAACGDDGATTDDERSASGEVLEGTISDSMLPLATTTSEPPLLPPEEQDEDGARPATPRATPTPGAPAEEGAEPAPSPEPTETAQPGAA